jgi:polysaccharide biosynthesis protein PslG
MSFTFYLLCIRRRYKRAWLVVLILSVVLVVSFQELSPWKTKSGALAAPSPLSSDFFGMTINHWQSVPWPTVPFASLRTWDTGVIWSNINRTPGVYDWRNFERLLTLAETHSVNVLFTFGQTPRWASSKPDAPTEYGETGLCAPPSKLEYWDDFVKAVVTQARGRIKFWEIWNEPQDEKFYCGDIPTMVELQKRAYKIIKALDPSSLVLTPSPVGGAGPPWMWGFLEAGGGQYADIMAFHGYWGGSAENGVKIISDFKEVFAAKGDKSKPIWDTEVSWGENAKIPDPDAQAAYLAKSHLLHWSAGISRLYWYAYDNKTYGGLWDKTNGLHKAGAAYQQIHKWMVGAELTKPCEANNKRVWTCELSRADGYQAMAVWQSQGTSSFEAPAKYKQYRDLEGNVNPVTEKISIGDRPILLETKGAF